MASIYCFPQEPSIPLGAGIGNNPKNPSPLRRLCGWMHCYLLAVGRRRGGKSEPENPRPRRRRSALASGGKPRQALAQRRFPLSLVRTPEPSFFSSLSSIGIVSLCARPFKPYLVSSGSPLLQATAPAREPLGPDRPPWAPREVAAKPRAFSSPAAGPCAQRNLPGVQNRIARPGPRPSISWATCKCPRLPRTCSLGRGGPRAVWGAPWCGGPDGSHAKDARGAGPARWSLARRWRIFGAHCAA